MAANTLLALLGPLRLADQPRRARLVSLGDTRTLRSLS